MKTVIILLLFLFCFACAVSIWADPGYGGITGSNDFLTVEGAVNTFEVYLDRADLEREIEEWLAGARFGITAVSAEWERQAKLLQDAGVEIRPDTDGMIDTLDRRLEERLSEWLIAGFFREESRPVLSVLAHEVAGANDNYLYVKEGELYLYDEAGDPVMQTGENINTHRKQWTGRVTSVVERLTDGWESAVRGRSAELLSMLPGDSGEGLLRFETSLAAYREGYRRELAAYFSAEESRFMSKRLRDQYSLRKKSEGETAESITAAIIDETERNTVEGLNILRTGLSGDGGFLPEGEPEIDADEWRESFRVEFDRGMEKWNRAEEELLAERILWEQDVNENFIEAEEAWAEAYSDFMDARRSWEGELSSILADGARKWERKEEELLGAIEDARAELRKSLETRMGSAADRIENLVEILVQSNATLKTAVDSGEYWLGKISANFDGGGAAFRDGTVKELLLEELKRHLLGSNDYRIQVMESELHALSDVGPVDAEEREAAKEELAVTQYAAALSLYGIHAIEGEWTKEIDEEAWESAFAEFRSGTAGWAESPAHLEPDISDLGDRWGDIVSLGRNFLEESRGMLTGAAEEGGGYAYSELGYWQKVIDDYSAYIEDAEARLAETCGLVLTGEEIDILEAGVPLAYTEILGREDPEGLYLDDYQIELLKASMLERYWREQYGIAEAVYEYARETSSDRKTEAETEENYENALAAYRAAGQAYTEAVESLELQGNELAARREEMAELRKELGSLEEDLAAANAEYQSAFDLYVTENDDLFREKIQGFYSELLRLKGMLEDGEERNYPAAVKEYLDAAGRYKVKSRVFRASETLRGLVTGDESSGIASLSELRADREAAESWEFSEEESAFLDGLSMLGLSAGDDNYGKLLAEYESWKEAADNGDGGAGREALYRELKIKTAAEGIISEKISSFERRMETVKLLCSPDFIEWAESVCGREFETPEEAEEHIDNAAGRCETEYLLTKAETERNAVLALLSGTPEGEPADPSGLLALMIDASGSLDPGAADELLSDTAASLDTVITLLSDILASEKPYPEAHTEALADAREQDANVDAFFRGTGIFCLDGVDLANLVLYEEAAERDRTQSRSAVLRLYGSIAPSLKGSSESQALEGLTALLSDRGLISENSEDGYLLTDPDVLWKRFEGQSREERESRLSELLSETDQYKQALPEAVRLSVESYLEAFIDYISLLTGQEEGESEHNDGDRPAGECNYRGYLRCIPEYETELSSGDTLYNPEGAVISASAAVYDDTVLTGYVSTDWYANEALELYNRYGSAGNSFLYSLESSQTETWEEDLISMYFKEFTFSGAEEAEALFEAYDPSLFEISIEEERKFRDSKNSVDSIAREIAVYEGKIAATGKALLQWESGRENMLSDVLTPLAAEIRTKEQAYAEKQAEWENSLAGFQETNLEYSRLYEEFSDREREQDEARLALHKTEALLEFALSGYIYPDSSEFSGVIGEERASARADPDALFKRAERNLTLSRAALDALTSLHEGREPEDFAENGESGEYLEAFARYGEHYRAVVVLNQVQEMYLQGVAEQERIVLDRRNDAAGTLQSMFTGLDFDMSGHDAFIESISEIGNEIHRISWRINGSSHLLEEFGLAIWYESWIEAGNSIESYLDTLVKDISGALGKIKYNVRGVKLIDEIYGVEHIERDARDAYRRWKSSDAYGTFKGWLRGDGGVGVTGCGFADPENAGNNGPVQNALLSHAMGVLQNRADYFRSIKVLDDWINEDKARELEEMKRKLGNGFPEAAGYSDSVLSNRIREYEQALSKYISQWEKLKRLTGSGSSGEIDRDSLIDVVIESAGTGTESPAVLSAVLDLHSGGGTGTKQALKNLIGDGGYYSMLGDGDRSSYTSALISLAMAARRERNAAKEDIDESSAVLAAAQEQALEEYRTLYASLLEDEADEPVLSEQFLAAMTEAFAEPAFREREHLMRFYELERNLSEELGALHIDSAMDAVQALYAGQGRALTELYAGNSRGFSAVKEAEWESMLSDFRYRRQVWQDTMSAITERSRTEWKLGLARLETVRRHWLDDFNTSYLESTGGWDRKYLTLIDKRSEWVRNAAEEVTMAGSRAILANLGLSADAGIRTAESMLIPEAVLNKDMEEPAAVLEDILGGYNFDGMLARGRYMNGSIGSINTKVYTPLKEEGFLSGTLLQTIAEHRNGGRYEIERHVALVAADRARSAAAEAVEEFAESVENANIHINESVYEMLSGEGFEEEANTYSREALVDDTLTGGMQHETQTLEGYEYYDLPPIVLGVDLSYDTLSRLSSEGIEAQIDNAMARLEEKRIEIFGESEDPNEPLEGEFNIWVGVASEMSEDPDPQKDADHNVAAGTGEMGRITKAMLQFIIVENRGWSEFAKPDYEKRIWDDDGSRFKAPTMRGLVDIGTTIAASVLLGPVGAAALNLVDDAVFTVLDVGSSIMSAEEGFLHMGKKIAAGAASLGINSGFSADVFVNAASSAGNNIAAKAGLGLFKQFSGNMADGVINSFELNKNGRLRFNSNILTETLAGKGAMAGYLGGAAGTLTEGMLSGNLEGLERTEIAAQINAVSGLAGSAASTAAEYGITGEAVLNAANVGNAPGFLELHLGGKQGLSMNFGTGGRNFSPGRLYDAAIGLGSWVKQQRIRAFDAFGGIDIAETYEGHGKAGTAVRSMWAHGDAASQTFVDNLLSGKDRLKVGYTSEAAAETITTGGGRTVSVSTLGSPDDKLSRLQAGITLQHEAWRDGVVNAADLQTIETFHAVKAHTEMALSMEQIYGSDLLTKNSNLLRDVNAYSKGAESFAAHVGAGYDSSADYWKLNEQGTYLWEEGDNIVTFLDAVYGNGNWKQEDRTALWNELIEKGLIVIDSGNRDAGRFDDSVFTEGIKREALAAWEEISDSTEEERETFRERLDTIINRGRISYIDASSRIKNAVYNAADRVSEFGENYRAALSGLVFGPNRGPEEISGERWAGLAEEYTGFKEIQFPTASVDPRKISFDWNDGGWHCNQEVWNGLIDSGFNPGAYNPNYYSPGQQYEAMMEEGVTSTELPIPGTSGMLYMDALISEEGDYAFARQLVEIGTADTLKEGQHLVENVYHNPRHVVRYRYDGGDSYTVWWTDGKNVPKEELWELNSINEHFLRYHFVPMQCRSFHGKY